MSDIEDYSVSSDVDSDNDSEVSFKPNKQLNKNKHKKPTISDYDGNDDDNVDNIDENEDEDDDVVVDDDNDEVDDIVNDVDADNLNENLEFNDDDDDDYGDDIDDDDEDDDIDDDEDVDGIDGENNTTIKKTSTSKHGGAANKGSKVVAKQHNINLDVGNDDLYDDDDEDSDENYLQKFDRELTKNYITDFHTECLNHNYDEIKCLSNVTRDEYNIIIDPLHKTLPFLTKYEQARVLGQRAKQIECGAKPLVKVPENIIDSYIIAKLELEQKKIPFIIRRPIPNGGSEYWNLKDLELIAF